MFCNFCGASNTGSGKFCQQCGKSLLAIEKPSRLSTGPAWFSGGSLSDKDKRRVAAVVLCGGLFVLLVVAIGNRGEPASDRQSPQEESQARGESTSDHQTAQDKSQAIAAIQKQYSPSFRLMTLDPDIRAQYTELHYWEAHKAPYGTCKYKSNGEEIKHCWWVLFGVGVMPEAESKYVGCEWLVDLDTMETMRNNVEARTMFVHKLKGATNALALH